MRGSVGENRHGASIAAHTQLYSLLLQGGKTRCRPEGGIVEKT